jgi:hypothetical protein
MKLRCRASTGTTWAVATAVITRRHDSRPIDGILVSTGVYYQRTFSVRST